MKIALICLILMLASHNLAYAQKLDYTIADAPPNACPGRLLYCKWYRACCPPLYNADQDWSEGKSIFQKKTTLVWYGKG